MTQKKQPKLTKQLNLFGLLSGMDKDISSSLHDEIMLWVDDKIEDLIISYLRIRKENVIHLEKIWEHPIKHLDKNKVDPVGFVDMLVKIEYNGITSDGHESKRYNGFVIEVKTTIKLGELIRQMRLYQIFTQYKNLGFIVVSPDDRYTKILREQGFGFIKYIPD